MRLVPCDGYQAKQVNTEENQISNAEQDDKYLEIGQQDFTLTALFTKIKPRARLRPRLVFL